ncbi:TIGR00269 family protein [Oceanithermus sp.]
MKCSVCGAPAQMEVRRRNQAFCAEHYREWFVNETRRNIKRHRMIRPGDRVLVAVSGGKDSLVLWDTLTRLGHAATGFHIQLGIGDYSERALETTKAFARERGLELIVVDVRESFGLTIPELAQATGRAACSGCGLSKRYLMNRVAEEEGFNVVATGHNLDDEAATLLGNVSHWQLDALVRQGPMLEGREGLARRIKPLYTFTEREVAAYAFLAGIEYQHEECPHAEGAKSLLYKDVLNRLETRMPGTKQVFLEQYLKKVQPVLKEGLAEGEVELRRCERCGSVTTGAVCAHCKLWDRAYARAKKRRLLPEDRSFDPRPRVRHLNSTSEA